MERIRVMIVDDSDFVRDGMRIILGLDENFDVVGCASNGQEAIELARESTIDVIVMDIQMPVLDGIDATKIIVKENLGKVLILTTFDDYELVQRAIKAGAKGYLIKNHTPDQLKQMIQSVQSGIGVMEEGLLDKLAKAKEVNTSAAEDFANDLYTTRELDIIEAVAQGLSNKEIATKLFLSEGTIKNYISTILEKSNLSHRTQLAVYYLTGRR